MFAFQSAQHSDAFQGHEQQQEHHKATVEVNSHRTDQQAVWCQNILFAADTPAKTSPSLLANSGTIPPANSA